MKSQDFSDFRQGLLFILIKDKSSEKISGLIFFLIKRSLDPSLGGTRPSERQWIKIQQ